MNLRLTIRSLILYIIHMPLPPARGKRVELYLNDEVVEKARRRWRDLDAKVEELLAEAVAAAEEAEGQAFEESPFTEMNPEAGPDGGPPLRKWDRMPVFVKKRRKGR